jgi:ribose transport system substrate-binding protein
MTSWKKATAAAITLATLAYGGSPLAQSDPGTAYYNKSVEGKKVIMVPMAMGFDLAQGWA